MDRGEQSRPPEPAGSGRAFMDPRRRLLRAGSAILCSCIFDVRHESGNKKLAGAYPHIFAGRSTCDYPISRGVHVRGLRLCIIENRKKGMGENLLRLLASYDGAPLCEFCSLIPRREA